jgi:FkbM family methyltransferase
VLTIHHAARFITRGVKARYRDAATELNVIRSHLSPTDIVCDIGANKGSFTFWLARWCNLGRVIAFEPQPEIASRLASNCRTLNFSNVLVEPIGVYSVSGSQTLTVPRGHSPGAALNGAAVKIDGDISYSVPVVSLDDYFAAGVRISLLKIDVEGAELHVLRGAERILKTFRPTLVVECETRHRREGRVSDVFHYLASLGYRGQFVCRGQLLPISTFDAAVHQRADGEWYWKSENYCNNFIFTKA